MHIKSYLDLHQLLNSDKSTKEQRRAFGLSHQDLKDNPQSQLMAWLDTHKGKLKRPLFSETFSEYMYNMTFLLLVIAFIVGLFSGMALLDYNGDAPVNVVYFMGIVIVLPLFTMILSLLSMFKVHQSQSALLHISPAYWMEKVLSLLPNRFKLDKDLLEINPLLLNWLVIQRTQSIALAFSMGLGLALLLLIVSKDIAFAWSTTLDMTPAVFHTYIHFIAMPWESFFPSAMPSLTLIEQSHYYRLGDSLSQEMIKNASDLGQWWKFLLMSTLFYAIFLRFLVYMLSRVGFTLAIEKSLLTLEGVGSLLVDMNEAIISTHAMEKVEKYEINEEGNLAMVERVRNQYEIVHAWAMSTDEILLINDALSVTATTLYMVGGTNSLEEDTEIVSKSFGEVLFYVKAWEPPTMDFIDYLDELVEQVERIVIAPIGTAENHYIPVSKAISVWERKLAIFDNPKVCFKVSKGESI
ncbi:hypothetical protein MNB_SV-13-1485 [hydrothermal vent metagenome]|uniref:DUF2868 domain-containing protein n=1 Tax=hydrothermal vent metagenome TaxID=652676 RepID=A0A1W1D0G6_9ZZZZ